MQGPTRKIFKAFLVSFTILIVFCLTAALFFKKEYTVTQSVEINAPVQKVFPLVADFSQWKEWSPWYKVEPSASYANEGSMQAVGSSMSWNGKIIGAGAMRIAEIEQLHRIKMNVHFEKHRKMNSMSEFTFESKNNVTTVTWTDSGILSYPFGRIFSKNIQGMIAKDFEEGLTSLKARAEKP